MHGLSSIVTVLLLLLIMISLALLFWLFTSGTVEALTGAGIERTERTREIISTCMFVDSVYKNKVYIQNCGDGVIVNDSLNVYLDDEPLEFVMTPEVINKGDIGTIILNVNDLLGINIGDHNLKISNPSLQAVQIVEAVLHDSCVLALDFDEGSGNYAYDKSRYGDDGAINGPVWTKGKFEQSLDYSAGTDYVTVSHSSNLDIKDQITIEAWLKLENFMEWGYVLAKNYGAPTSSMQYGIYLDPGEQIYVSLNSSEWNTGYNLPINSWKHIVVVWNSTTEQLFIDGKLKASNTKTGTLDSQNYPLNVGNRNNNGVPGYSLGFNGKIDSVRIYNKALTPDETIILKMK